MNLGSTELLIIVIIAVVLFGGSWLPKAARNLGRAKVEVDKAQQQLNEAKTQVIEATGIEKADEALRKANRALNTTPQGLMKNAARSAVAGGTAPDSGAGDDADADVADDAGGPSIEAGAGDPAIDGTVNVDFTDD